MTEPSESVTRKLQALLETAMREDTPQHERELAQEKADQLMAKHRLDRANLNFTMTKEEKRKPIATVYDMVNLVTREAVSASQRDWVEYDLQGYLNLLRRNVFQHCSLKVHETWDDESHKFQMHVFGYQEDVFFAELLWNSLFFDMANRMFPKWSSSKGFDENVYILKKAGYSWSQVREMGLAVEAKDRNGALTHKNAGSKLRTAFRRHANKIGEEVLPGRQQPQDPHYWRQTFVSSYTSRIRQRLYEMEDSYKEAANLPAMIVDMQTVEEMMWERFPNLHPDEVAKRRAEWEARPKEEKTPAKGRKQKPRKIDENAWTAGYDAASEVNLSAHQAAGDKKEALA